MGLLLSALVADLHTPSSSLQWTQQVAMTAKKCTTFVPCPKTVTHIHCTVRQSVTATEVKVVVVSSLGLSEVGLAQNTLHRP